MSYPDRAEWVGKYDKYAFSSIQPIDWALSGATTPGNTFWGTGKRKSIVFSEQDPQSTKLLLFNLFYKKTYSVDKHDNNNGESIFSLRSLVWSKVTKLDCYQN